MIEIRREVLVQAFEHFRRCGAGRRECVVYLTAPVADWDVIDGVVHPRHAAGPAGYDLDSVAIGELWRELLTADRCIRMQAHTHPGSAYHSARDDRLAIVDTPGFLSLVIPNFASGEVGFDRAFLAERTEDGCWIEAPISDRLAVIV